nr:ribonuclease H-like domain-containing protein [Tanacetum cinerariifolium]
MRVIEFGDSYKVPTNIDINDTTRRKDGEHSGRTATITTEDMQRKKDDVKARTTLLLSLPDEHYLAPEWMMHTIVWRNRNDLDTISLDDLYNHLKVYEAEVQTKSNLNSQNMAFISSSKNNSGNEDGNIACVSTASTTFPTGSVNVATICQDTAFVDNTVTDYSRPLPTVASTSAEGQIKDSSTSKDVASPNPSKPFVKFVKPKDSQSENKTKE